MTIDHVRDTVARHPDGPIPTSEARNLANELHGTVCLLCLEMARIHYHLSLEASPQDRPDCLTYAINEPSELDGIWGAHSKLERRAIRLGRAA